jgi:hypothetical protein
MTHLPPLMIEELQRRNIAEYTIRACVHGVEHFGRYFHRSPGAHREVPGDVAFEAEVHLNTRAQI